MNISFSLLRSLLRVLCALVLLARPGAANDADTDAYGGSTRVRWEATGWFRLQQNDGRFWQRLSMRCASTTPPSPSRTRSFCGASCTFYAVASLAYRKNDPHHLVLGEMYLQISLPDGMLKQGLLQRNGEPYPDYASQIAAFNHQTLDALYNGLKP